MKRITLFSFAVIMLSLCCNKMEARSKFAVVYGTVPHNVEEIIFGSFEKNKADLFPEKYFVKADSYGNFKITIPLMYLNNGYMQMGKKLYKVILQPGDELEVGITDDTVVYSGRGANKNIFINLLDENKKCSKSVLLTSLYREKHTLNSMYLMIDEYIGAKKSEYDKFFTYNSLSKEFIDYFKRENRIEKIALYQRAARVYSRKNNIPEDSVKFPAEFEKQYTFGNIVDDRNLINDNYLDILNRKIHFTVNDIMSGKNYNNRDSVVLSVVMDSLSGKTREFYVSKNICYNLCLYDNYDSVWINLYDKLKSDKYCIKETMNVINGYLKKKELVGRPLNDDILNTVLYDTADVKMTFAGLLDRNKGNVLYIDVWSLNCGPCRLAMKFEEKMKKRLAGLPVKFLCMTTDNYYDKLWNDVSAVTGTLADQYRFDKGSGSGLCTFFNIVKIPAYIIINKDGKLVSYNAGRPFTDSWKYNSDVEKILKNLALSE